MADGAQVRANVQAFIAEVTGKVEELVTADRSAEVDALQAQLDAIDADIAAAREQFAGIVPGGTDTEPVEPEPEQPVDPNAPSRAPGF